MTRNGKGSKPRPYSVSLHEYHRRWVRTFEKRSLDDGDRVTLPETENGRGYKKATTEEGPVFNGRVSAKEVRGRGGWQLERGKGGC